MGIKVLNFILCKKKKGVGGGWGGGEGVQSPVKSYLKLSNIGATLLGA